MKALLQTGSSRRVPAPPEKRFLILLLLLILGARLLHASPDTSLDLAGDWRFALDPADAGLAASWHTTTLPDSIRLPGSLQDQGLGLPVTVDTPWTANVKDRSFWTADHHERDRREGDIRMPCWLTPANHYVGPAWYQKTITLPESWRGKRVTAHFERVHWFSRLWVNGTEAPAVQDTQESLGVPHVYDLGVVDAPGPRTLTLRIDNRMLIDVGDWAHSISDHTQGNWNGVVGSLTLSASTPVLLDDVQLWPDHAANKLRVSTTVRHDPDSRGTAVLRVGDHSVNIVWPSEKPFELELPLPANAARWDEFNPALHSLVVELDGQNARDRREITYGLRDFGVTPERDFSIDGTPILLRGTLECAIFPLTGYPPTDEASWERFYRIARDHGLNHFRFHSWTPPRAAFTAADRMGFYLQIEMGAWTHVGKGRPQDAWLYREAERVLREYGNHPSFVLLAYGNEPLPYTNDADRDRWLSDWVDHWKSRDPRRLYTSAGFYPQLPENQFHITHAGRGPRSWPNKLLHTDPRVPILVHEMGQYCVYPDFKEMDRYTGHLKPRNFEIFRDTAKANGVYHLAEKFLHASGRLQVLCYKEDIEATLRTRGAAGYQLLDLRDFPGQGTALVGVLNALWEPKGYVTAAEYRRFSGITVPLIRAPRVVAAEGTLTIPVDLAHYGPAPTPRLAPEWTLRAPDGAVAREGKLPEAAFRVGRSLDIGTITLDLASIPAPATYTLEITLPGTTAANDWPLHVFPAAKEIATPAGVAFASKLSPALAERAAAGETLLIAHPGLGNGMPVGSFTPVFWNRQWFSSQATRTLGLLIDPAHPALAVFPSAEHTTWAWKEILERSRSLDLRPGDLDPVVRWIDDWNTNLPLALVGEARVGKGRVLLIAADLHLDLDSRPAARQLRRSLLAYAASADFAPQARMQPDRLAELVTVSANLRLDATAQASSAHGRHPPSLVVDGNPDSFWQTPWNANASASRHPHEITLSLPSPARLKGVLLTPRQDVPNGRPRRISILTTSDTSTWRPVASATLPDGTGPFPITFPAETVNGVRVVCEEPQRPQDHFASMAEVDLIEAP